MGFLKNTSFIFELQRFGWRAQDSDFEKKISQEERKSETDGAADGTAKSSTNTSTRT
jgi:hypothetical protein